MRQQAFSKIYTAGTWLKDTGHFGMELANYYTRGEEPSRMGTWRRSFSGHGSDLGAATRVALAFLREAIRKHNVTTMLDVPCGDANWQFEAPETDSLAAYAGLDIAHSVVRFDELRFAHHVNKRFAAWDFAACALPRLRWEGTQGHGTPLPFELVHSRDVFQHLSHAASLRALRHIVDSGARLLIATTFGKPPSNDMVSGERAKEAPSDGGFAQTDLHAPPFVLPPPTRCVRTHPSIEPDYTCLYVLDRSWKATWRQRRKACGEVCSDRTIVS